ncbi:MAG: hypothetical protein RBT35_08130 [Bacteroidales bacterium]|jgi:hypothetical protein|nr:hypothetical protein [Bacteroidales bacterium]
MALTEQDYLRAANDPKFMAARWKQRVAISQIKLDEFLASGASEREKKQELLMHKKRVEKLKEAQQKLKR